MNNKPAGLDELVKGWEGLPGGGGRPWFLQPSWVLKGVLKFSTQRRGKKNLAIRARKRQSGVSQEAGVPGAQRVQQESEETCLGRWAGARLYQASCVAGEPRDKF